MRIQKTVGSTTLAALAAGTLLSAGLASAPSANATCASFWGLGNGGNCTSTPTSIAIAIGPNAVANATGLFGTAFAIGSNATALNPGSFSFAVTAGDNSTAQSLGNFNIAAQLGAGGSSQTSGAPGFGDLGFNIALNVALATNTYTSVQATGLGNLAVNLFGTGNFVQLNNVVAGGVANIAANLGGASNTVVASNSGGPGLNLAINAVGSNNNVYAGPGPVAISIALLQNGQGIIKNGPGININGIVVGGASAVNARKASPAAASKPKSANSSADNAKSTGGSKRAKKATD